MTRTLADGVIHGESNVWNTAQSDCCWVEVNSATLTCCITTGFKTLVFLSLRMMFEQLLDFRAVSRINVF